MKSDMTSPSGTVRDWLETRATQDQTAFVFPETGEALDWPQLRARAGQIAAWLTAKDVRPGESVAVMMPNGREAIETIFGVLFGGFRLTMINLVAGPEAIAYALEHSEARFAFVDDGQVALFEAAAKGGVSRAQVPEDFDPAGMALHPVTPGAHALLMYTSGTTGRPKGVVHSHASLLAGGWTTAMAHALAPSDRGLCVLPVYHINGLCVSVMGSLVSGGSLAICPRFSNKEFWKHVKSSRATWFSIVPTIISHLLHSDIDPDAETKQRLRFGRSASAPLAPDVQTAFETRFGIPIIETMGLTETAAQILSNPLPPAARKIGSPGIAIGNEVQIVGPDGAPCPPDTEGEIAIRGPNVMLEYLKNPEATDQTFRAGWLKTGDLGRRDAEGYFFVTGRVKELIIKGGENIAPREIDDALYAHADVIEAAAFACPCTRYGERVEAAVALKPGTALSEADLIGLCRERLGDFKTPDRVHFMEELPKGPSGKIQRMKLAEILLRD